MHILFRSAFMCTLGGGRLFEGRCRENHFKSADVRTERLKFALVGLSVGRSMAGTMNLLREKKCLAMLIVSVRVTWYDH